MEKRPGRHTGATGCKSIGADGCKSSGRRKSNLRQRRDARGSEAESAGGWSSAAAVQRIPHPALLLAPGSLGHTQSVRGFSSRFVPQLGFLLWKNPATGFPAPREMLPAGFYCLGWQQAQEGTGEGDCRQLLWEQQDGAVPCWVVLFAVLWGGGSRGEPQHGVGGGPHPSPAAAP